MYLSDLNFLEKLLCRLPDCVLVGMEWLAKIVLLLAFLSLPVALASLHEIEITKPVQPSADCISVMAADGDGHGRRVLCFAGDFFTEWGNKFVVFLTLVAVDCEPMANDQANKECEDRRSWRTEKLIQHGTILLVGVLII